MLQHSTVPAYSDLAYCRPYPLNTVVPARISTKQSVAQTDPFKKKKRAITYKLILPQDYA